MKGHKKEEAWFTRLKFIPSEPWEVIIDGLYETAKMPPTIGEIKQAYFDWLRENPDREHKPSKEPQYCPDCCGRGVFDVRVPDPMYGRRGALEHWCCSACENWRRMHPGGETGVDSDKRRYRLKFARLIEIDVPIERPNEKDREIYAREYDRGRHYRITGEQVSNIAGSVTA